MLGWGLGFRAGGPEGTAELKVELAATIGKPSMEFS